MYNFQKGLSILIIRCVTMSNHNLMIEIGRYDQNPKVLIDGVDNLVH